MGNTEVLFQQSLDEFNEILHQPAFEPVFESIEKSYSVKRETIGYCVASAVGIYLVVGAEAQLLCNGIGVSYPAYVVLSSIRWKQSIDALHWLSYWTIYSALSLIDFKGAEIMDVFPIYYLAKAVFLIWLMLHPDATSLVYRDYIEPAVTALEKILNGEEQKRSTKRVRAPRKKRSSDPYKIRKEDLPKEEQMMLNEWTDFQEGDVFPPASVMTKAIRALNKSLDTLPGEQPDQYVALCYHHGEPIMGRVWNDNGKIAASFSWNGHDIRNKIESMMVLFEEDERGFDYDWRPYPEAASFEKNKIWHPVHVDMHGNVDISPGVITVDGGKQILGKVDVRNEKSSYAYNGKEYTAVGPAVHSVMVLCRKARPGFTFK